MSKCVACKTGNLVKSGCHEYCDNCAFRQFIVTDEFIDGAVQLLAIMCSNTKFSEERGFGKFVGITIQHQLPKLHNFLQDIGDSASTVMMNILAGVTTQAINLQIGNTTLNEEKDSSLVCNCGCTNFIPSETTDYLVVCAKCHTEYIADDESGGTYYAYFTCHDCGCNEYSDHGAGLVSCAQCTAGYMHNRTARVFARLT